MPGTIPFPKDKIKLCECGCGKPAPISKYTNRNRGRIKGQPFRYCVGHWPMPAEAKDKMSKKMKGRKLSQERIEKMKTYVARGENHPLWKGDSASYASIHMWLARHLEKTGICQKCFKYFGIDKGSGTQWANISGRYKREFDDFIEVCRLCHEKMDGGEI
jgi:hypothetical protein